MEPSIDCLLNIDVGTSSLKAVLFDLHGQMIARETAGYRYQTPVRNQAEQDPEDWWAACCKVCRKILEDRKVNILAVSVCGQAPGCVPVKADGSPLRPAILWLDRRADPQAAWLREHLDLSENPQIGVNTIDSYFGGVKWLWYRQNEPERYDATWKILQPNGFLVLRLTGEAVTDPSHAGICSPCFDFSSRSWSDRVCSLMQIEVEKLPMIHPSSEIVGAITPNASQESGLPAGAPVICGAADFVCSHLGSGAASKRTASIMLGTAGNLMAPAAEPPDTRLLNTVYFDNQVLSAGGVLAGAAVSWFVEMLKTELPDPLAALEQEAAAVPPGAENLLFLPFLMGERSPIWDPDARGVYFGLTAGHQRGHLYRALLEGTAHAFRGILEILAEGGQQVEEAIVINGGARSPLWRGILANVTGVPIRWRPNTDSTSLGGACLAALAGGMMRDLNEVQHWLEPTIDTLPDPRAHETYVRQHQVYAGLYALLKDSFKALKEIPAGAG